MANFKEAFGLTGHNEGGYANNPNDHGGETFAGIARKFWPAWSGWLFIDGYKQEHKGVVGINSLLTNGGMQNAISSFYKQNFWDINKLDQINDQQIADNVYDCGVNSGTEYAARVMQKAAGMGADGIVGSKTIAAVNEDAPQAIYDSINAQRVTKYHELAQAPGQLVWLKSWMSRIKPYKTV
jgi:lysozyme family protein